MAIDHTTPDGPPEDPTDWRLGILRSFMFFLGGVALLAFSAFMLKKAVRENAVRMHPAETVGKVTGEGYGHGAVAYEYVVGGTRVVGVGVPERGVLTGDPVTVFYSAEEPTASFLKREKLAELSAVNDAVPYAMGGLFFVGLAAYSFVTRNGSKRTENPSAGSDG
jgi:hypothetical protein